MPEDTIHQRRIYRARSCGWTLKLQGYSALAKVQWRGREMCKHAKEMNQGSISNMKELQKTAASHFP